jgi:hypothetical protein
VTSREERVTRNETTTRDINEGIEKAHLEAGVSPGGAEQVRVLCECGRMECDCLLAITIAEYEAVRADPRRFAVAFDHVKAEIEEVVAQTDRFIVVAKREGIPAQIATDEDPRA